MTGMMDHVTLNKVVSKGKRDEPRAEGDDSVGKELQMDGITARA